MFFRQPHICKLCRHREAFVVRHEYSTTGNSNRASDLPEAAHRSWFQANIDIPEPLQPGSPDEQQSLFHLIAEVIEELIEFPIAIDECRIRTGNDNREKTRIVGDSKHH